MTNRPVLVPAVLGVLAAVLTGCVAVGPQEGVLTLTGSDAVPLPACDHAAPVPVAALASDDLPACEPVGQVLVFPDGGQLQLPEESIGAGSQAGSSDVRYSYSGVGRFGVVAAQAGPGCVDVREWGTPEALRRVHDAFGSRWMCD
ncbi:hypothetical protein ACIPEQ_10255 [Curtobacterium sp. NPDC087080]|uniref:hypothetical protein n=1 Tax=Curtobacterium sp. NPDC087080 TaxID=3363965 RepID=UPI0038267D65